MMLMAYNKRLYDGHSYYTLVQDANGLFKNILYFSRDDLRLIMLISDLVRFVLVF